MDDVRSCRLIVLLVLGSVGCITESAPPAAPVFHANAPGPTATRDGGAAADPGASSDPGANSDPGAVTDPGASSDPGGASTPTEPSAGAASAGQSMGGLLGLYHAPHGISPGNCGDMNRDDIIVPVRVGQNMRYALASVNTETGLISGSCGGFALTQPRNNRWHDFALLDDGTLIYRSAAGGGLYFHSPEALSTCGPDCFDYEDHLANDQSLDAPFGTFLVQPKVGIIALMSATQWEEDRNILYDSSGQLVLTELDIPREWTLLSFGPDDVTTDRLILRADPTSPGTPQKSGVLALHSARGPVRSDGQNHQERGYLLDAVWMETGYLVAFGDEDHTELVHIAIDGVATPMGDYAPQEGFTVDGVGGRLKPDGCIYVQALGPGRTGALIKRCINGENTILGQHPPCKPKENACVAA